MNTTIRRLVNTLTAGAAALGLAMGSSSSASATVVPEGGMACTSYVAAYLDAPDQVPATGEVTWRVEVTLRDVATGQVRVEHYLLGNVASPSGLTIAEPWRDVNGTPVSDPVPYSIAVGTPKTEISVANTISQVYRDAAGNRQEAAVSSWQSRTASGATSCILDGGPIVV